MLEERTKTNFCEGSVLDLKFCARKHLSPVNGEHDSAAEEGTVIWAETVSVVKDIAYHKFSILYR